MIRLTNRPSTAKCTLGLYTGMLISEPVSPTCTSLAQTIGISHDSVNRFLDRERYEAKDLYDQAIVNLKPEGGIVSVDDTVIDKPYSQHTHLVSHFWSGKHHKAVKGLNLITLYYTDCKGISLPINYRLYDHQDNLTKNDYFLEMLSEVLGWGLSPSYVTGDSWYSSKDNLKAIRNEDLGFMFAIKANRTVSITKGQWEQVQALPEQACQAQTVWLKDFGLVRLFRTRLKDQVRHYVLLEPKTPDDDSDGSDKHMQATFKDLHDKHWGIEQFHRALKQLCSVEKFQVRRKRLILNHVFASILGFVYLSTNQRIKKMYQWYHQLFRPIVAAVCRQVDDDMAHLRPSLSPLLT